MPQVVAEHPEPPVPAGPSEDDTAAAMLAATAIGLSLVPREDAPATLRALADGDAVALTAARARLTDLVGVDDRAVHRARQLLDEAVAGG